MRPDADVPSGPITLGGPENPDTYGHLPEANAVAAEGADRSPDSGAGTGPHGSDVVRPTGGSAAGEVDLAVTDASGSEVLGDVEDDGRGLTRSSPVPAVPRDSRQAERQLASSWSVSGTGTLVCDAGRLGPLILRAASVTGTSHAVAGALREDTYGFCRLDDRSVLLALADGLSSTRNAHAASALAVRRALDEFTVAGRRSSTSWEQFADEAFGRVARALAAGRVDRFAADLWPAGPENRGGLKDGRPPATTLVVAHIELRADGTGALRAAGVGDSSVVWSTVDRPRWRRAFEQPGGPSPVTSATPALPSSWQEVRASEHELGPGSCVLLCSDGMAETLTPGFRDDADPDLALGWASPPDISTFLADVQLSLSGCVDDRTALAAWLPMVPSSARS